MNTEVRLGPCAQAFRELEDEMRASYEEKARMIEEGLITNLFGKPLAPPPPLTMKRYRGMVRAALRGEEYRETEPHRPLRLLDIMMV